MAEQGSSVKRILIAEDEPDMLTLLTSRLEASGYQVLAVTNGEDALATAMAERPDLIVLDVMLPGMDGYQVCRFLKGDARSKDIPVIMFTAKAQENDERLGLEAGAEAYLRKPFKGDALLEQIRLWLTASQERRRGL